MYEEIEQDENVARGCVKVKEIIAYDFVRMEKEIDELTGKPTGKKKRIEKGSPYFCQTKEQEQAFKENNPGIRTEMFEIQLLKSTAIKYLNDPENIKQFTRPIEEVAPKETAESIPVTSPYQPTVEPSEEGTTDLTWRQQARQLGIPMYRRTKAEVLADIASQTTVSTR